MLDLMLCECTPRFALNKHDAVLVHGVRYQPVDETDKGYVLVRADGQGVAESYSRTEMARLVELGQVTRTERFSSGKRAGNSSSQAR